MLVIVIGIAYLSHLPALKEIHIEELVQLDGELNGCLQVAHVELWRNSSCSCCSKLLLLFLLVLLLLLS